MKSKTYLENRIEKINSFDGQIQMGANKFNSRTNRSGKGKPSSGYLIKEHGLIIEDTNQERYIKRNISDWIELKYCPICDSSDKESYVERMGLSFKRCKSCGHVYQDPVLKRDVASRLYSDDKTTAAIYTVQIQKDIDAKKYNYGLDLIDLFRPDTKEKILDIGCGAGVFLQEAFKKGYKECVGIDANSNYKSEYKKDAGINYISSTFESLDPSTIGGEYDVITMWSVLEHIYEPQVFLNNLKKLLKPNGLVFILVPNLKSLATRLTREMSPCFNWKHPHYFHTGSLEMLMSKVGFKQIHCETVISEIDNIKSYMSGEFPYHGYGDPENLFEFITPEYIHNNLLGSRLISIFEIST